MIKSSVTNIFSIGTLLFFCNIVLARPSPSPEIVKREISYFEERFINSLDYQVHNDSVKLIGYKKLRIPADQLDDFEDYYFENVGKHSSYDSTFYDGHSKTLRLYFPVEAALLQHGNDIIEANHLGEFDVEEILGDVAVLGRKQTDHVHGVEGNIIEDGVIYLAEKNRPTHRIGRNIYVFDFGMKSQHHHHDGHSKRDSKGCVKNHGGKNCSDKYNIHHGRCPFVKTTCMDYNGPGTDCKKEHKVKYFVGSDCATAVSKGHCWNEMDDAVEGLFDSIF